MNPNLNYAINELTNLQSGETFLLKDLFKGYLWNRISRNDRTTLGTLFLDTVTNSPNLNVQVLGKNSANQQMYQKQ